MTDNCDNCFRFGEPRGCECPAECCRPADLPLVVGVDLSLTCTGVVGHGFVDRITSSGHEKATLMDRQTRLTAMQTKVGRAVANAEPDLIVIEGPAMGSRVGQMWDRAGLWWRLVDHWSTLGYPIVEVPPSVVKKYATGKGNASKDEVLAAVVKRYQQLDVVDNNTADAAVLYAMGMDWLGSPVASVPQVQRNALASVRWPEGVAA